MTALVWAGVAVLVLLVVDGVVTRRVRQTAADRISRSLDAPVDVHVRGWPASLRLPLGKLSTVRVEAREVPTAGMQLTELAVDMSGVRPRSLGGEAGLVVASAGGRFIARLDPEAFRSLAPLPSSVVSIGFEPELIRFGFPGGVSVPASVSLDGDVVVLTPEVERLGPLSVLRFAFPLEELPFGAAVDEVHVRADALLIEGTVGPLEVSRAGVTRR